MKLILVDYEERIVEVDVVAIYVSHSHKTAFHGKFETFFIQLHQ